jgi:methyltransferase (TIGR00027 family)
MKEEKSSYSAEVVAAMRAIEAEKAKDERICFDPYAKHFLRPSFQRIIRSRLMTYIALRFTERKGPGFPGGIVVRTRYIDDLLHSRIEDGIEQLVILGAGYDTRPYRFDALKSIKVFEVDDLATQNYKISTIENIFGSRPSHVIYVPVDFNKEKVSSRLYEVGFDRTQKTFFIWEGVTMYLTSDAVDEILAFVTGNSGPGSSIYFDYMLQSVLDGRCDLKEAKKIRDKHSFSGQARLAGDDGSEAYIFGIEDETIEDFLSKRGFFKILDMKSEQLKKKYFYGKNQKRKVHALFGYVHAMVDL